MIRKCGGKNLKTHISSRRYTMTELNTDKKIKKVLVHRAVYETFIGDLIPGFLVHHKDEDKNNNHYSNLAQIDYIEHNNIHSHPAWNKGIKNPAAMVENAQKSRLQHYIPLFKETFELRQQGKSNIEIAKILNISDRTVIDRIKRYKEIYNL